jgi:hypothetical protein
MTVNSVYFSDAYGIKKIDIINLVGESQSQVSSITTYASLPTNKFCSMTGNYIDDYFYLVSCFDNYGNIDAYGTLILKNDGYLTMHGYGSLGYGGGSYGLGSIFSTGMVIYGDGYHTNDAFLTNKGILYHINRSYNRIDTYYGATFRSPARSPDYIYSSTSTPAILVGEITCMYVVDSSSVVLSGGARIYVGTTLGLTRLDTYDDETDGYSNHMENYGIATTYSIADGIGTYQSIGGTISRVVAVSSDEEMSIIMVSTNDGYGNGGLTQIAISGNRKIIFMSEANSLLPTNNIRDIFGKGY